MPMLLLCNTEGAPRDELRNDEASRALRAMGFECGRWSPPGGPISSAPQLTYARELIDLERRFGSRRIEWARIRAIGRQCSLSLRDDEVCVVLERRLNIMLPLFMGRGFVRLDAGEWLALSSGQGRTLLALGESGLQLLRLHAAASVQALAA